MYTQISILIKEAAQKGQTIILVNEGLTKLTDYSNMQIMEHDTPLGIMFYYYTSDSL